MKNESDWLLPAGIGLVVGVCIAHLFTARQGAVLVPVGEAASAPTGMGSTWIPTGWPPPPIHDVIQVSPRPRPPHGWVPG